MNIIVQTISFRHRIPGLCHRGFSLIGLKWSRFQVALTPLVLIILGVSFLCLAPFASKSANAKDMVPLKVDNSACENKPHNGHAALFYDFDRITVAYLIDQGTYVSSSLDVSYPKELKSDAMVERIQHIVETNFSKCLEGKSGAKKPVEVIQGGVRENSFDEKNLIITVTFLYRVESQKKPSAPTDAFPISGDTHLISQLY